MNSSAKAYLCARGLPGEEFQQAVGVCVSESRGGVAGCSVGSERKQREGQEGSRGEPGGQQGKQGLTCVGMDVCGCFWHPSPALLPPLQGLSIAMLQTLAPRGAFLHCHFFHPDLFFFSQLNANLRDLPGGPVVKTSPSNAGGAGSIPGRGAKIPHASWPKNQNIK